MQTVKLLTHEVPISDLPIEGLVQERCNSSALAMELHLSCTNPLIWVLNIANTAPADVLPPNGAKPCTSTLLMMNLDMFSSKNLWISYDSCVPDDIQTNKM